MSDGRGENKERKEERSARKRREREEKAVLLVELSGRRAGRRGVRWQESGTAAQLCFCVEGPSRLVSLYFIVREKKGRETQETYDVQRVRSRLGVRQKELKQNEKTDPGAAASVLPDGVEEREGKGTLC